MGCGVHQGQVSSGKSLLVLWLGLHASAAGGTGSIPRWGTKIPHALRCSQKKRAKKKKIYIYILEAERDACIHTCKAFPTFSFFSSGLISRHGLWYILTSFESN